MQISRFRIYRAAIGGGLGLAVGIAIGTNMPIIALAAVVVAVVLAIILERRNKEIVRDERIMQISWKAAYAAFISVLILAAAAALGTALFHNQLPENVVFLGSIMGYFVCIAIILHICLYAYFSRKL
ncbi:MAG: DUF2178 domain-containing protein [Dehalococcoidia bacterium]|nr:DUF2178 domain-containing protein [Dehalococcoidia bacterium]